MGSAPKTRTQLGWEKDESTNLLHTHPPHTWELLIPAWASILQEERPLDLETYK